MKPVYAFLALVLVVSACGKTDPKGARSENITNEFIAEHKGTYADLKYDYKETFTLEENGRYAFKFARRIGAGDGKMCGYIFTGKVSEVIVRSDNARRQKRPYATHLLIGLDETVGLDDSLVPESSKTQECIDFVTNEAKALPYSFDYYFEILSKNELRFHTNGDASSNSSSEETELIKDEVFTRQ